MDTTHTKAKRKIITSNPGKIILGIDPGTNVLGYGLLQIISTKNKRNSQEIILIEMGVIHLSGFSSHHEKLQKIFTKLKYIIQTHKPHEVAIEAPFFGKNVQSMLKLGRAQGVAITVAMTQNLPVFEYSPKKIKQSVTGNGNASKEQVASMLTNLLTIKNMPDYLDATDALAAAVCHHFQSNLVVAASSPLPVNGKIKIKNTGKSYSGWKDFIQENPKRVNGK